MSRSTHTHAPLWLALRFPQVALDLLQKNDPQQALVIIEGKRIYQACQYAQALGIHSGMSLQSALLLSQSSDHLDASSADLAQTSASSQPQLLIRERCQQQEQRHMQQLAQWAYQFTPYVSYWQSSHSLLLELGSCLKLFGGLPKLLNVIQQPLLNRQLQVRPSLAHTPKAAWLLGWQPNAMHWHHEWLDNEEAFCSSPASAVTSKTNDKDPSITKAEVESESELLVDESIASLTAQDFVQALKKLSLAKLPEQPPFTKKLLQQWQNVGLHSFGELVNLPRTSIAKRYGKSCLKQLDQIIGLEIDLQTYITPSADFLAERHYLSGLESVAMLERPTMELLTEFQQFLRHQQLQTEGFCWRFFHFNKQHSQVTIELSSAHTQADIFFQLTQLQLHQHHIDSPIETVRLHSDKLLKAKMQSQTLFNECGQQSDSDAQILIDTLATRMGKNRLYRLQLLDDHLPECRQGFSHEFKASAIAQIENPLNTDDQHLPMWLLASPIALRQSQRRAMTLLSSAYRIDSHWWRQRQQRDYFVARDTQGHHWIYFDHGQKRWFLHGHYG